MMLKMKAGFFLILYRIFGKKAQQQLYPIYPNITQLPRIKIATRNCPQIRYATKAGKRKIQDIPNLISAVIQSFSTGVTR